MTTFIKAPTEHFPNLSARIFLAGSIEMGKAEDWQTEVEGKIATMFPDDDDVVVYNPRRDDWDSSWIQDPTYGSQFNTQVSWELRYLNDANVLIFNLSPGTISPVTMLELGMHLDTVQTKMVICPPDFQRYGNIKLTTFHEGKNVHFYEARDQRFYDELGLVIQRKLEISGEDWIKIDGE